MLTSLFFFFSSRDKELLLFAAFFDLIFFCALSFFLGYHSSLLWVIYEAGFVGLCDILSRRYFTWREMKRLAWLAKDQYGTFPKPWMYYADLWAELFRKPMGAIYVGLFIFGKLCASFFA